MKVENVLSLGILFYKAIIDSKMTGKVLLSTATLPLNGKNSTKGSWVKNDLCHIALKPDI